MENIYEQLSQISTTITILMPKNMDINPTEAAL